MFADPLQTLVVLAFIAAGVPVYWWRVRGRDGKGGGGGGRERSGSVGHGWMFWKRWQN